jgi:hypothetical protein
MIKPDLAEKDQFELELRAIGTNSSQMVTEESALDQKMKWD